MPRWPLRIVAGLLAVHALLGFAITPTIFPGLTPDALGFAQHGFAFLFLALLNVTAWRSPRRSSAIRVAVHGSNLVMLGFYAVWCVVKPEAPNYTAAVLLLLLTVIAALSDASQARIALSSAMRRASTAV